MDSIKKEFWKQFGAALDMFQNALEKCPDSLWDDDNKFWYNAYHCLFFTDYGLTTDPDNFHPPEPYTLSEFTYDELPERTYTKEELVSYTQYCREKCRKLLPGLDLKAERRWIKKDKNYSMFELLLQNIRHLQHHTGQLNMELGKINHDLPIWVSQTKIEL